MICFHDNGDDIKIKAILIVNIIITVIIIERKNKVYFLYCKMIWDFIILSHLALEIDVSDQESYIKKLIREVLNQQDVKLMGQYHNFQL